MDSDFGMTIYRKCFKTGNHSQNVLNEYCALPDKCEKLHDGLLTKVE